MQASNKLNNISRTIKAIHNNGGYKRFWKGSLALSMGCVPAHACYFSVYEFAKVYLGVEETVL